MTTEHIFLSLFAFYMILNTITDIKFLVTKNYLHYPMAITLLIVGYMTNQFAETFLVGVSTLLFFIIYRNLPIHSFGAGDVKMLVNTFMLLSILSYWDTVFLFFTSVAVYVFTSVLSTLIIRTILNNWKTKHKHAEAPVILIALSILLFLVEK